MDTEDLRDKLFQTWNESSDARLHPWAGYRLMMRWAAAMIADAAKLADEDRRRPFTINSGAPLTIEPGDKSVTFSPASPEAEAAHRLADAAASLRDLTRLGHYEDAEHARRHVAQTMAEMADMLDGAGRGPQLGHGAYLRALAAAYLAVDPGCPANTDGSGEWSIDDVAQAVGELRDERDALTRELRKADFEIEDLRNERDALLRGRRGLYSTREAIAETDLASDMSSADAIRELWKRLAASQRTRELQTAVEHQGAAQDAETIRVAQEIIDEQRPKADAFDEIREALGYVDEVPTTAEVVALAREASDALADAHARTRAAFADAATDGTPGPSAHVKIRAGLAWALTELQEHNESASHVTPAEAIEEYEVLLFTTDTSQPSLLPWGTPTVKPATRVEIAEALAAHEATGDTGPVLELANRKAAERTQERRERGRIDPRVLTQPTDAPTIRLPFSRAVGLPIMTVGSQAVGVPDPTVDRSNMTAQQCADELARDPVHGWRCKGVDESGAIMWDMRTPPDKPE